MTLLHAFKTRNRQIGVTDCCIFSKRFNCQWLALMWLGIGPLASSFRCPSHPGKYLHSKYLIVHLSLVLFYMRVYNMGVYGKLYILVLPVFFGLFRF